MIDAVRISTHVLDTAFGAPTAGVSVTLERMEARDRTIALSRGVTDADGRVPVLAPDNASITPGAYRLCFHVADYFAATQRTSFYNEMCVNFIVATSQGITTCRCFSAHLATLHIAAVDGRSPATFPRRGSMTAVLAGNSYGKSAVRLLKVVRDAAHHDIREFAVDIALEGAFEAAHVTDDNGAVLPTDTMKNTVYAKARELRIDQPEEFGLALARHFLDASAPACAARVRVTEHGWRRLDVDGVAHDHAFERASAERRIAHVAIGRTDPAAVTAGIEEQLILESGRSAFPGFRAIATPPCARRRTVSWPPPWPPAGDTKPAQ